MVIIPVCINAKPKQMSAALDVGNKWTRWSGQNFKGGRRGSYKHAKCYDRMIRSTKRQCSLFLTVHVCCVLVSEVAGGSIRDTVALGAGMGGEKASGESVPLSQSQSLFLTPLGG